VNNKVILHVDINSYFATLLQQENPNLRGKPVAIVKDPGRTCIIAASKEAKKYGVKTGSILAEAKTLCPEMVVLPADFDRFLSATKALQSLFQKIAPHVYIYSLDEAFIDISDCLKHLYPDPEKLAQKIQEEIKNRLGEWVTSNVGISDNYFLAKMASEIAPKGSILRIDHQNKDYFLASVGFEDVCGIGFSLQRKLKLIGITVPYQIRFYSQNDLKPLFGPFWSKELIKMAYGEEPHHLELLDVESLHMKSVGRSITGFELCDNENDIKRVLLNLIEEVTFKARKMNLAGRYLSISLAGEEKGWKAHKTLKRHINHTSEMFEILYHQLYQKWQRRFKIIRFAVRLGLLEPITRISQSLLPEWQKNEAIYKAADKINDKYGLFTVKPGSLLGKSIIKPEVTGFLGDRIYQLTNI